MSALIYYTENILLKLKTESIGIVKTSKYRVYKIENKIYSPFPHLLSPGSIVDGRWELTQGEELGRPNSTNDDRGGSLTNTSGTHY